MTTAYAQSNVAAVNTWGPTGLLARNSALNTAAPREVWYTFDILGNVAQRLDEYGAVRSSDSYDAYGRLLTGGDPADPYGYKGQVGYYTDHATGLILCTYRYYDPATGGWLTRDPIGYAGGLNLYEYCGGDPVGGVDPDGKIPTPLEAAEMAEQVYNDLELNATFLGGWVYESTIIDCDKIPA